MMKLLFHIMRAHTGNVVLYAQALLLISLLLVGFFTPETVVFGYFFETIIIGLIHAVKLFLVIKHGREETKNVTGVTGYAMVVFFLFHYGMFVGIQMMFVFGFFESAIPEISSGFDLTHNFYILLQREGMLVIVGSLLLSNLGYFYANFWSPYKYREYAPSDIFFTPYVRIFIQQFVVILAGFFMVIFQAGMVAAILLLVLRLLVDLCMVAIRKDSEFVRQLSEKLAKPGQDPSVIQQQLERLSE